MKKIYNIILGVVALFVCGTLSAQNLNSAYFLDGYTFGHQLNPAKDYDRKGYVSFPLLSNINMGLNGSLSLTDVFKFNGDQLTTFMNPIIPVKEALSGFSANNNIATNYKMDILGFGFTAFGGFNTFNLSVRTNFGANLPYGLFEFIKEFSNNSYDISGVGVEATSWAELGLGHSRQVTDAIRVGGKVKGLLPAGRAMLNIKKGKLDLTGPDKWIVEAEAEAEVNLKGFEWGDKTHKTMDNGESYEEIDFNNINVDSYGPNGWGLAFDLGAEWDLGKQGWVDGLTVSAAVLDLGFLSWQETHTAYNKGTIVEVTGFNDISVNGGPGTPVEDQTDAYSDKFSSLLALQEGETGKSTSMLGATLNVGVEYELPFYNRLSFGLLSTTRFQGRMSWNEERISATISPIRWLEFSANVGFGTLGTSVGWVANLHPRGFNIFVGMDHTITQVSKQFIPLSSNGGVCFGINFPFGASKISKKTSNN